MTILSFPRYRPGPWAALIAALFLIAAVPAISVAQESALAMATPVAPRIEYTPNESGGRITLTSPTGDSATVESVRVLLLESAAAVRRGDFRGLRLVENHPVAMQVLADRRGLIRCTVRLTARGGDLVLLSDDHGAIAAIHQLLTQSPPGSIRL